MLNDEIKAPTNNRLERKVSNLSKLISLGITFGLIGGIFLDNITMGLVTGLNGATFINALIELKEGKKGGKVALAISASCLIIILLIWNIS